MDALIVSPHLDDAVLSLGQFIGGNPGVTVVTVFAGKPNDPKLLTPYDEKMGFNSSQIGMMIRQNEDGRALQLLKAKHIHLPFLDGQYGHKYSAHEIAEELMIMTKGYEMLIAPLGISHPDHILVSEAVAMMAPKMTIPVFLYAELPYRVMQPGSVWNRADQLGAVDTPPPGPSASKDTKLVACREYRSQWNKYDIVPRNVMVTEGIWRLK